MNRINIQRILRVGGVLLLTWLAAGCEHHSADFEKPPVAPVDTLQRIQEIMAEPATCGTCHPNHYQEWRTSMHAYAIHDPMFQTLNRIAQQNAEHENDQFCTKCHTPIGKLLGETAPGFEVSNLSPLAQSSIFCDVCHTRDTNHSPAGRGVRVFHLDGVRRGPIEDPQPNDFHASEFDPAYKFSGFCNPCHNVQSPDGSLFLEETGMEWSRSPFGAMGIECQNCHMPTYSGQAAVGGPQRESLHRHYFTGVDYPLIDFPGRQETIRRVRDLLENAVEMRVEVDDPVPAGQPFTVRVTISNDFTGHDIPTGTIFERQMWIELIVRDVATGTELFATGTLDANGDLRNYHSELVANGTVPEDTHLVLFHGIPRKANGEETLFFWEAASVERLTIPAFASHTAEYTLTAPSQPTDLEISVRLRFRSFPPYLLRAVGQDALIPELIIFDMETDQRTIAVTN